MEIQIYFWIGCTVVWLCFGFLTFKLVGWIVKNLINWLSTKFTMMWKVFEYFYYRKDFNEWIKDKERHPKINEILFTGGVNERFDSKYAPPFRIGRRESRAVLDSNGIEVIYFKDSEKQAIKYRDYLNGY